MFVMLPTALALYNICEERIAPGKKCTMLTPFLSCTTYDYVIYDKVSNTTNGTLTEMEDGIYYFNFSEAKGDYIIKLCDNSTREIIVGGEDEMASLAIVIFILTIILGLFVIPFKTRFARSDILNDALKRCCWILALWLLSLSTAMVATIADNAGIELLSELFLFMFLINWGAYLFIFYVFFSFFLRVVQEMRDRSKMKRTGNNE